MELSLNQCRQIAKKYDLRDFIESLDDQPEWLPEPITDLYTIHAIQQGGCASGAYMPAVTYYTAAKTMAEDGDDVLEYIQDNYGEIPAIGDESWSSYACTLLSLAVESWATQFELDGVDWD